MIRRTSADILSVLLILTVAVLFSGRVKIDSQADRPLPPIAKPGNRKEKEQKNPTSVGIIRETVGSGGLPARNIFAPEEGTGESPGSLPGGPAGGTSYSLIGILQGEEKKAVFMEKNGTVTALTLGKNLKDGYTVTRIDPLSVVLEKGEEKKELKVFDLSNPDRKSSSRPDRPGRTERSPRRPASPAPPQPQQVVPPQPGQMRQPGKVLPGGPPARSPRQPRGQLSTTGQVSPGPGQQDIPSKEVLAKLPAEEVIEKFPKPDGRASLVMTVSASSGRADRCL